MEYPFRYLLQKEAEAEAFCQQELLQRLHRDGRQVGGTNSIVDSVIVVVNNIFIVAIFIYHVLSYQA